MIFVAIIIICHICLALNFSLSVPASLFICLIWNDCCHWSQGDQLEKRWFKRVYYTYFGNFTMLLATIPFEVLQLWLHLKKTHSMMLKSTSWTQHQGLLCNGIVMGDWWYWAHHYKSLWDNLDCHHNPPAKGISFHSDVICNIFFNTQERKKCKGNIL